MSQNHLSIPRPHLLCRSSSIGYATPKKIPNPLQMPSPCLSSTTTRSIFEEERSWHRRTRYRDSYSAVATARAIQVLVFIPPPPTLPEITYCRLPTCCVQQPSWSVPFPPNRPNIFSQAIHWSSVCQPGWQLWWGGRIEHLCRVCRRWLCRGWPSGG